MQSPIADALVNAAAGTIGGIISYSTFYPLENFRTRLQCRGEELNELFQQYDDYLQEQQEQQNPPILTTTASAPSSASQHSIAPSSAAIRPKFRLSHAQKMIHQISNDTTISPTVKVTLIQKIIDQFKLFYYQFLDTMQYAKSIYDTHGLQGFYAGLSAGVFGIAVSNMIYLYWYQLLKDFALKLRRIQRYISRRHKSPQHPLPHKTSMFHNQTLGALDNILIASLAGVINITLTNPIWVVNTRMMLQEKAGGIIEQTATLQHNIQDYCTKFWDEHFQNPQTDGQIIPITEKLQYYLSKYSVKMCDTITYLYNQIKLYIQKLTGAKSIITEQQQQQKENPQYYTSIFDGFYKMIKYEGVSALYRGYAASLVLVLNPTVQYVVYDQIVDYIIRLRLKKRPSGANQTRDGIVSSAEFFLISAFTKALATILTYPYQCVKARQQQLDKNSSDDVTSNIDNNNTTTTTNDSSTVYVNLSDVKQDLVDATQEALETLKTSNNTSANARKSRKSTAPQTTKGLSLYQTMLLMYRQEGIGVFFGGLIPKLIQTVSNAAFTTVLHEKIKAYIITRWFAKHSTTAAIVK